MPELDAEHREQMRATLEEHDSLGWADAGWECACGHLSEMPPEHYEHQADVITPLVAGWLADARAEALWETVHDWLRDRANRGGDDG